MTNWKQIYKNCLDSCLCLGGRKKRIITILEREIKVLKSKTNLTKTEHSLLENKKQTLDAKPSEIRDGGK